jgi:site-specific recombinase XerC
MPTAVGNIHREQVEAFITGSPMAKMRPPKIPEKPVPVLPDHDVRRLLDSCADKDFRDRRDLAIIRLFLDTGMRLEGTADLRYNSADPELSDVDLRSRVVRVVAKGRRELVLPIGAKAARDIGRYIRVRADQPHAADPWLWLGKEGRLTASGIYQMIKGAAA